MQMVGWMGCCLITTKWSHQKWVSKAQLVQQRVTGWMIHGSNPGGGRISTLVQTSPGTTHPPVKWIRGLSHGDKIAGAWSRPSTPSKSRSKPLISLWAFMAHSRMKCYDHITPVLHYTLTHVQYTCIVATINFSHIDTIITKFYLQFTN